MINPIPAELARDLPSAAVLDRLVYLVGPARGGTSVLHQAMNIHPQTLVLPNVTHYLQRVWRYHRKVHHRMLQEIIQMPTFWDGRVARKRLGDERYPLFRQVTNRALDSHDLAEMYKLYPMMFALTPGFTKSLPDIACWHDKENDWRFLVPLARAFPSGKFIFVVRDPRSVALSGGVRLAIKAGERTKYPPRGELITMALYWRLLVQRCLDIAGRYPDRSLVVRFEDFLENPVRTLNRVFTFTIGAPMDDAAVEGALSSVSGGATNSWAGDYSGVSREPLDRWKSVLQAEDIAVVEQITAPTAQKLGYDIARKDGLLPMLRNLQSVNGGSARLKTTLKALLSEAYEMQIRAPL
jgi:hypothetical protein